MDKISLIKKILLCFEQSSTSIKYDKLYFYNDGPNNIKQITVSFGVTEWGNLKKLIQSYVKKGGPVKELEKYIPEIGKQSLVSNADFLDALKKACKDNVMALCQEEAYNEMYIDPAMAWCKKGGLELPLSKLVVADSFLHSGSILPFLRNKFSETLPSAGGQEKSWITAYTKTRKEWLATHTNKILNNTVYRPNLFLSLMDKNDWELNSKKIIANGVTIDNV
jgi:chitosanase